MLTFNPVIGRIAFNAFEVYQLIPAEWPTLNQEGNKILMLCHRHPLYLLFVQ
jgi:hypothetical protein